MAIEANEPHARGHRILTLRRIVLHLRAEGVEPTIEKIIKTGMDANLEQEADTKTYDYTGGTEEGKNVFKAIKTDHVKNILEGDPDQWIRVDTQPDETCHGCQLKPQSTLHCYSNSWGTRKKDLDAISDLTRFTRRSGYDFRETPDIDQNPTIWIPRRVIQNFVFREESWY